MNFLAPATDSWKCKKIIHMLLNVSVSMKHRNFQKPILKNITPLMQIKNSEKYQLCLKEPPMTQHINNAVYRNAAIAALPRRQVSHVSTNTE
jgi:hypothetical protein